MSIGSSRSVRRVVAISFLSKSANRNRPCGEQHDERTLTKQTLGIAQEVKSPLEQIGRPAPMSSQTSGEGSTKSYYFQRRWGLMAVKQAYGSRVECDGFFWNAGGEEY